jgi:hypothetical protein
MFVYWVGFIHNRTWIYLKQLNVHKFTLPVELYTQYWIYNDINLKT